MLKKRQEALAAEMLAIDDDVKQHIQLRADPVQVKRRVNAWTQWGKLKEIVVGVADHACFPPAQPAMMPTINDLELAKHIPWPEGRKSEAIIAKANEELQGLCNALEKEGVRVLRPERMDWHGSLKTPFFEVPNQYCSTCGRDSLITVGNIILEASMSRRDRYFEVFAYRDIIQKLWRKDENMLWKACPKPSMADEMYNASWWDQGDDERYDRMHDYDFNINNSEPIFDAADITRCGRDIFAQLSMTCNQAGIDWLTRELKPHGIRVHQIRVPYDLAPSHLDCTFVPLKPGLVLCNPDRPVHEADAKIFKDNGWRFITAPLPDNEQRPAFSQSSKWLSMNILVISPTKVIVEEQEKSLMALLESEGFTCIPVPFRNVFEFGGGLHCATWDTEREDEYEDFFPIQ